MTPEDESIIQEIKRRRQAGEETCTLRSVLRDRICAAAAAGLDDEWAAVEPERSGRQ